MADGSVDFRREARDRVFATPLDQLNPAQPEFFVGDSWGPMFERLRAEAPVHYTAESDYGPFWSISRYHDIMAIDTNHQVFSSAKGIGLSPKRSVLPADAFIERESPDSETGDDANSFINMDPPGHDIQRKTVSPAVAPAHLANLAPIIRERAAKILDDLPIGEAFDWVDKVSIELTTMTLATLFDFPWEDRRKLTFWSDVVTSLPESGFLGTTDPEEHLKRRHAHSLECVDYFTQLWNERLKSPGHDLISMLAHGEATRNMDKMEYLGNLILLIVGGNDTTRNTISGSVVALNQNPDQDRALRANPDLVPGMVSETVRWQTPLAHMRRTALRDIEFGGQTIREGDKVVMWYISGNRDAEVIDQPDRYWIERPRVRQHLSFGFGIHRCVGNRLAELQLKIIWEEILARFPRIEIVGPAKRTLSSFVHGFEQLPVVIPTRN
jgi:cytochrome P450